MEGILEEIGKMLDEKLAPITNRLGTIEHSLSNLSGEVEKIKDLETKWEQKEMKQQLLEKEINEVKFENKKLREELILQETYSRKKNIRIYGIDCHTQQNLEASTLHALREVGVNLDSRDIENVHFIGQGMKGARRPVLLRLCNLKDKQAILSKKEALRKINLSIQEDYPREVIERRKMLLPIYFKARELYPELNPKCYVDKINLGGRIYTVDNIDTVQYPDLLPERVFTPAKDGIQAYFTKFSPLSNFYPFCFQAEGKNFPTSEHYFTYKKALHFGDSQAAEVILNTKDPEKVKQFGKKIQGFDKREWYKVSTEYMFQAMLLKFSQSEKLKGYLLSTSGNKLIEASAADKVWGIGLSLRNPDLFKETKWAGKNLAGQTLERVRQQLM